MAGDTSRRLYWLVLPLTLAALAFYAAKKHALGFHTRDYQRYLELYDAKLGTLLGRFPTAAFNPSGRNFLGFTGPDSFPHVGMDVHFSPVSYPFSAVFNVFGEFTIAAIFAGLVALAVLAYLRAITARPALILMALALLTPTYLIFASFDLRMTIPFGALAFLVLVAAHNRAGAVLILALLATLATVREEAYWIAIATACLLWVQDRRGLAGGVLAVGFAGLALAYLYFFQTPMRFSPEFLVLVPLALIPLAVVILARMRPQSWPARAMVRAGLMPHQPKPVSLIAWTAVYLFPLWLMFLANLELAPPYFILLVSVAGIAVWAIENKKIAIAGIAGACLLAGFAYDLVRAVEQARPADPAAIAAVWDLARNSPAEARFLTGLAHHQALWDRDVVVWERLPALHLDDTGARWPQNADRLAALAGTADFVVLDEAGMEALAPLGILPETCETHGTVTICAR